MKKKIYSIFIILIAISLLFSFSACSKKSPLVGRWFVEEGYAPDRYPESMMLNEDGTGIVDGGISILWYDENGVFKISSEYFNFRYKYSFSGEMLYLTRFSDNNTFETVLYRKIK